MNVLLHEDGVLNGVLEEICFLDFHLLRTILRPASMSLLSPSLSGSNLAALAAAFLAGARVLLLWLLLLRDQVRIGNHWRRLSPH